MVSERLVEEAAKAIREVRWSHALPHSNPGGANWTDKDLARAALAVFEAAQAPTGDEREELIGLQLASYFKRMSDGYTSSIIRSNEEAAEIVLDAGFRLPVQGEPTDARWIDEIETKALAQVASNARMVEIGEGVGGLGVRHPRMFEDLLAWQDASENDHADTVLRLIAALRAAGVTAVQGGQVVPCARCGENLVVAADALNSDLDVCGRCGLEIGAAEAAEQGEVAWEIGYQLLDPDGNSVGVGWPFPSVAEADESGARRAREESDRDPMWPTAHRVVRRRVAGEWLPVEQEDNHA